MNRNGISGARLASGRAVCCSTLLWLALSLCPGVRGADGTPVWTNSFYGHLAGYGSCVGFTSNGNVAVAGTLLGGLSGMTPTWGTVLYSPAGTALWTNTFAFSGGNPEALATDALGNIIVAGECSNTSWAMVKYSGSGTPLWTNYWLVNSEYGSIDSLALDGNGNIFAAGLAQETGNNYNYATIACSGAGVPLWTNSYPGANTLGGKGYGFNNPYCSLAVDAGGNVLFFGELANVTGSFNCVQIKYSNTGTPLATNLFLVPTTSIYAGMARDAAGNVFINAGSLTLAYNSVGMPLWTNVIPNASIPRSLAQANNLAVDKQGGVFVTAVLSSNSDDYVTVKYSNAGMPLWTNYYNGPGNNRDLPNALILDNSGNVYVTGTTATAGSSTFSATIKYSNGGVPLWTNICGLYSTNDFLLPYLPFYPYAMAVDGTGNLYVTGGGPGSVGTFATFKYSGPPVPLSFTSTQGSFGLAGGQFSMLLSGPPGSNAVISGGSDFQTWVPLITNPLTGGTFMFTDALATNYLQRFYRAALQ